jgi:hypothetical protein
VGVIPQSICYRYSLSNREATVLSSSGASHSSLASLDAAPCVTIPRHRRRVHDDTLFGGSHGRTRARRHSARRGQASERVGQCSLGRAGGCAVEARERQPVQGCGGMATDVDIAATTWPGQRSRPAIPGLPLWVRWEAMRIGHAKGSGSADRGRGLRNLGEVCQADVQTAFLGRW